MRQRKPKTYPTPGEKLTVNTMTSRKARREAALFLAKKAQKTLGFPRHQLMKFRDLYLYELTDATRRYIDGKRHSRLVE